LKEVEVNLGTMKIAVNFKVIKIIDEKDTYPTSLGFKRANDNEAMINLKMGDMLFGENYVYILLVFIMFNQELPKGCYLLSTKKGIVLAAFVP
jgi:hypothetical protein